MYIEGKGRKIQLLRSKISETNPQPPQQPTIPTQIIPQG